ncbi:MAG: DUF3352 domain-containing protein, partial [Bacteroidetes bacterium]|nr:DUF3352 domain-containing protein [Bacteroidota bacterium]
MKIKPFLKYFILTLILLLLLAGGYFAISYYRSLKSPVLSAYNAIPQSTALFAEFTDPSRLMDKLTDGSPLWSEFLSVKSIFDFQQNVLKLDSLISEDSQINGIIHSRKTVVCICCADSIAGALFLCELPSTGYESVIKSFITRVNSEKSIVMQKKSGKGTISLVNIPGIRSFFNFSVYKGLFIGSFRESLVKEAIKQLESGIPVNTDENFKKIEITAGKNVDANIYLNYPEFTRLVSTVAGNDFLNRLSYLSSFSQWTGADLIVKPDELFINGYTVCSGSENHWLNVMEQEPQNILLPEILPSGISFFVHWGLEDYGRFQTSLKEYRKSIEKESHREQHSKALKKELGLDIEEEFISWAGHEIALATEDSQGLPGNGKYVVIHAADIVKAKESLGKLSEKSIAGTGEKPFILKFEEYEIRKVRIREMFPFLFGELFGGMECPFYTTMRDYVVFADTPEALTHLIRSYYDQKTLAENTGYRSFSNNISEKSNVYVYCNIRNSIQGITGLLEKTAAEKFMTNPAAFRNLDGLSLQFSHIGDMFYTSMYLRYNPSIEEEIPSGWVAELTGNVTGKPYFTRNDETGKLNVLAFDDQSNMYRLDHFGKIIWKTPLIELPVSEVFQLAKDGASSQQYLFNTENYVYLMDGSGNYIDGYPAKLTPGATNGLTLLDNEGNKNYRMVLALSDNRIYDYNLNLVQSEGWYKITARGKVN